MIIDPALQASLRAKYSPPGSPLQAVQNRLLEMLRVVDKYCREHEIKYWLSSGTCLGAIRHGGYIPWDDDVDIEMDYKSYRRLRKLLRKHPMQGIALHDHNCDTEYMLTFPKLRDLYSTVTETAVENDRRRAFTGLYIDIFPMTPSCSLRLHHLSENFYHLLVCRPFKMRESRLRTLLMRTVRPFYYKVVSPIFRLLGQIGAGNRRRHLPGTAYYAPRDACHFQQVKYVDFEGLQLPVPENADAYLTGIFGDWRSLPDLNHLAPHLSQAHLRPRP